MAEAGPDKPVKGPSLYSIVSAQAGGVSDAILRVIAASKLDDFKGSIKAYLAWFDDLALKSKTLPLQNISDAVYSYIVVDTQRLLDAWKAGLGLQMGTAYMGLEESFIGTPQLLTMYRRGQLENSLEPRMDRYWRAKYTPTVPNSKLAFQMCMEGQITRAEFGAFCLLEGWPASFHDKLYEVYNKDPDIYTAFSMYKRGLINLDKMKSLFRIQGFDSSYDALLYEVLHRVPTLRELTNLSDFVQLPDLYVREKLRGGGYAEGDIAYLAAAINRRPIRDEVRSVVGRYLYEYQLGRLDRDTLKSNLSKLGLLPSELELQMLWGDLRYQDELLDEKVEIIRERVYKHDLTTEAEIVTELTSLGILEEKANLMAEYWWWYYIASIATFSLIISVNNGAWGTTLPAPDTYVQNKGDEVTIYGVPNTGYVVDHWLVDTVEVGVGEPHITVTMTDDHDVECVFAAEP